MGKIDLTTISTIRPGVFKETFQSLKDHLCYDGDFHLILDIAPVGEEGFNQADIAALACEFFLHPLIRMLSSSLQAEAQKWVWGCVSTPYFLQWEDDWKLLRKVCVKDVLAIFEKEPNLAMVFFDRAGKSVKSYPGYQRMYKKVGDNLYERVKYLNFGGPPAMVNRRFVQWALGYLKGDECFDITCERPGMREFLSSWKFYTMTSDDGPFVQDLGKPWMKAHGFTRNKKSKKGMIWIKK